MANDEREESSEAEEIKERQSPSSAIVHETIIREGIEELDRPNSALSWSGLACGLSMGFSLVSEAALHAALPDTAWRPLVAKLGYSVGFLIVILGRQQLFTENTLTPILPLLDRKTPSSLANVLRLWVVVFAANLLGAFAMAFAITRPDVLHANVHHAMIQISREAIEPSFGTILLRGVFAGWLIALIVWLLPFAEAARLWVIILITYVIGIAHFSHVIAGAVEVFTLSWTGDATWAEALVHFILPALIGNVIGGVALVASLNHAQVVAGK
jgi:formate/nitrite transporter FocA (FNT family)